MASKRIDFDLVDRRRNLIECHQIEQTVGVEIADADCAQLAATVSLLHRAPRTVHIAERLVDQVQIEIVELQPLQRLVDRQPGRFVTGFLNPQFAGDEKLLPGDAALFEGIADGRLVEIGCGRIDQAVARTDRIEHAALALGGVGYLEDAKAEHRHPESVIERDIVHFSIL